MINLIKLSVIACSIVLFHFVGVSQTLSEFGESKLPIVNIETGFQDIPDDPKISGQMGIIWNADSTVTSSDQDFNHFNGKIAIELRGSSSQSFPKKSYGFELRTEADQDTSISILGIPKEEDWILYAPYSDKSLIRNVLTFTLDAQLGHYSPRCRFVHLFLNKYYRGVYVLMEKIKRDKNRVDIAKLNPDENTSPDLSGGYLIKIDKTTGSGGDGWHSSYANAKGNTFYQYEYPKHDGISSTQKQYIKGYVDSVENALNSKNIDGESGFRELVDENSFIDFFLMNELSKNVDGFRLSTYLHKDKGGKLKMGPIWDFNLAFGNANYHNAYDIRGFQTQANLGNDYWQNPFWWSILLNDDNYRKNTKTRWQSLRKKELSDDRIHFVVDSLTSLLASAQAHNFDRWRILGGYVWPNKFVGQTYHQEIDWLENWIDDRLEWLDLAIDGLATSVVEHNRIAEVSFFPNPVDRELNVQFRSADFEDVRIAIFNLLGVKLLDIPIDRPDNILGVERISLDQLQSGVYLIRVSEKNQLILSEKFIKK